MTEESPPNISVRCRGVSGNGSLTACLEFARVGADPLTLDTPLEGDAISLAADHAAEHFAGDRKSFAFEELRNCFTTHINAVRERERRNHEAAIAEMAPKADVEASEVIPRTQRERGKLPILVDQNEHRVTDEATFALANDPDIYQRGNLLVRVLRGQRPADGIDRSVDAPTIGVLPLANLRDRLTRQATFHKYLRTADDIVRVHPPPYLASAIDARGEWPRIRALLAVSEVPVLRPDGTLLQTAGYDSRTGVLYEPPQGVSILPVPEDAALDDASESIKLLLDVCRDFRFEAPEHRSAWLAGVLTPLARYAFAGPAPLHVVDANVRGAGKGLCIQAMGQIVQGREMAVSSYSHDPDEMRKKITAAAIAGDRLICLDNVEGKLGNEALDRALTSTRWKDRLLGKSEMIDLPLTAVWYATANNVQVSADTARRMIAIRLDVMEERPEERSDFTHPNLVDWIRRNRPRLLRAALIPLVAFCNAGRPKQNLTPFGSFEGWSDLVRQALVWAGQPDPCLTRGRLAETSDTTVEALVQLMNAWRIYDSEYRGLVMAEVVNRLYPADRLGIPTGPADIAMRAALENLVGAGPGKPPTARQVGNRMRALRRRVVMGMYLDQNPTEKERGGAIWRVWTVSDRDIPPKESPVTEDLRLCDSNESIFYPFASEKREEI